MIHVRVKYLAPLRNAVGRGEEIITLHEGSNIEDLISCLSAKYEKRIKDYFYSPVGELELKFIISVDNRHTFDFKEVLVNDAEVIFVLPIVGG